MNPEPLSLPKESLLQQTNSWKGFLFCMKTIIESRAYRYKDLCALFHWIDPFLKPPKRNVLQTLRGFLIGPGFISGRKALYFDFFALFITRYKSLFRGAPAEVIRTWNELVLQFFPEEDLSHQLLIDLSLAYRERTKEEQILEAGSSANSRMAQWISENKGKEGEYIVQFQKALSKIPNETEM